MDYKKALADGHKPEDVMAELSRRGVQMNWQKAIADGHDPVTVMEEMNARETSTNPPISETAATTRKNETQVPEWGVKYPNLYGAAAAGLEVGQVVGAGLAGAAGLAYGNIPGAMAAGGAANAGLGMVKRGILGDTITPKNVGVDVAAGALGEGLGAAIPKVAGKVIAPFASKITPERARLAEMFNLSTGEHMLPADVTRSKLLAYSERAGKTMPFSSDIMQGAENKLLTKYSSDVIDPMLARYGGKSDMLEGGTKAVEKIAARSKVVRQAADKLYDDVETLIPAGAHVMDNELRNTAQMLLKRYNDVSPSLRDQKVISVLRDVAEGNLQQVTPKPAILGDVQFVAPGAAAPPKQLGYDWQTWKTIRSRLGELISEHDVATKGTSGIVGQGDKSGGAYKLLQRAMERDTDAFASNVGGGVKDAIDLAKQFYKTEYKQVFNAPVMRRIARSDPEKLVDTIFTQNSATSVNKLRKALGDREFDNVKGTWLTKNLKQMEIDANNNITAPNSLSRIIDKYDDSTLKAIFNKPGELKQIKDIAEMGKQLRGVEVLAGNPSGSATNAIATGSLIGGASAVVGGLATGNIPMAAGGLLSLVTPPALAKLYLSPAGRKLLTEGYKITPGTVSATKWLSRAGAIAGGDIVNRQEQFDRSVIGSP